MRYTASSQELRVKKGKVFKEVLIFCFRPEKAWKKKIKALKIRACEPKDNCLKPE